MQREQVCITLDMMTMLTSAFVARLLYTAALENSMHACSSSAIADDASGDRGPRVTIVPKTT